MTNLEDRIRGALQDPRWELPAWRDPMARVRRAVRRQRAAQAAGIGALIAVVVAIAGVVPLLALRPAGVQPGHGSRNARLPGFSIQVVPGSGGPRYGPWTGQLRGEVAYECDFSICLMRPDGSARRSLGSLHPLWDAAWSPDGRSLAFRGYYGPGDGQYDLYSVSADDCHLTRLTRGVNGDSPSWSPAGREIAFGIAGGGIDVVHANGTGLRRLTTPTATYEDDQPAWSVTNRIAFVRTYYKRRFGEIYTTAADGRGVAPLTHGGPGFDEPSWSPDGRLIAFVASGYHDGVIDVATGGGSGVHGVSPSSWDSSSPTWTPGGKIAFLAGRGGQTSAYVVNPDGTGLRLLYPDLDAEQIAWAGRAAPAARC